ncbi:MAG: hypothetical protein MUF55_11185, partial [Hydrogenophaga sp.]|nr:hypothetical protein [Hydrogenophaga sp.]
MTMRIEATSGVQARQVLFSRPKQDVFPLKNGKKPPAVPWNGATTPLACETPAQERDPAPVSIPLPEGNATMATAKKAPAKKAAPAK